MEVSHRHLLNLALEHDRAEWTDGQLLEGFVSRKDVAALDALVSRHGPMVWGVCCRLLRRHDAEDAFQATFLILLRKAASIRPRDMVGNWLYGVAHQAALNARTQIARRGSREVQVAELPEPAVTEDHLWTELKPLLDQELSSLPSKYRVAVLLCDLEGKSRKEAAQELGLPEGTVASRLARGRSMLANRLARHGLVVSAGTLEAVLGQKASGAVPNSLIFSTTESLSLVNSGNAANIGLVPPQVASLTEGVLNAMFATKLKIGLAAIVMFSIGTFTFGMLGAGKMDARTDEPVAKPEKANEREGDAAQLLKVTIKPDKEHVQFLPPTSEEFKLALRVENVSKEMVSFESASCSWDTDWKTSTKRVYWKTWECFSNKLVTVELKPGEAYEKSLTMLLAPGDPVDKVSFKMGFTPRKLTPKSDKQTFWSNEITININPANKEPGIVGIPAPMPNNVPQRIDPALLKARLDAAKEVYEAAAKSLGETKRVNNTLFPVGNPEEVYTWSVRFLEAHLELSEKKDERIVALEAHVTRMKVLRLKVETMALTLLTPKEVAAAKWYEAEAEILLAREKSRENAK